VRIPSIGAQRLANLEQWIDAHLHESITLGRLCQVTGVGGRSLQATFFGRRGMSPMRFVTEPRLRAARRELEDAGGRTGVSEVVLGNGFAHLGRFAIEYLQVFRETPSQTLARRL
jgi:transcriptional regulator GlxA family with amidase domain